MAPATPGSPTPTPPPPSTRPVGPEQGADAARSPERRRRIRAFNLWDGGMSAFSSVILTFVFATYVTSGVAAHGIEGEAAIKAARDHGSEVLSTAQAWAAVVIALLAPLLGNLADAGGRRNLLLRVTTLATIATVLCMPLVRMDPSYLWLGAILIAVGVVFSELAGVFTNSVLPQISTPADRGRISGTAWATGYWGSILCLGIVLLGFVMPGTGLLGITAEDGWNLRAIPVFVALWMLVGTLPLLRRAPAMPRRADAARWTPWQGYLDIGRRLARAWRDEPVMLAYLISSAIYRDGLGAIFSLAGVLAANAYGFSTTEVIVFGIAANLIAGFGVFLGGRADDRFGPRAVIIAGCIGIIVIGAVVLLAGTTLAFWICGLLICLFVGPVQSASRNLLTRLSKESQETEDFGLYATTGRAFGFLGPAAFALCVGLFDDTRMGMLGILAVLVLGLAAFAPIRLGAAGRSAR